MWKEMQVNTVVYEGTDWKIKVHSGRSQYKSRGAYFTCCSLVYRNGASVGLVSIYSKTEALATSNHIILASRAKELFGSSDLKDRK